MVSRYGYFFLWKFLGIFTIPMGGVLSVPCVNRAARSPLGGSLVILTPFCSTCTGKLFAGMDVSQRRKPRGREEYGGISHGKRWETWNGTSHFLMVFDSMFPIFSIFPNFDYVPSEFFGLDFSMVFDGERGGV